MEVVSWLISAVIALSVIKLYLIWSDIKESDEKLKKVPKMKGDLPIFGHILPMITRPPWDTLSSWVLDHGPIIRFNLFGRQIIAINQRDMLKRVLQLKFHQYQKDKFTYAPFKCLLGTGLVTSEGELWKSQRAFIGPAFRNEILQDTAEISRRAVDRLCKKLEKFKGTGEQVEMAEEFRKLTLQVIGEAVLSLSPEESDSVFPELYLPIVEESNRRTWYPFRAYLPLPATFAHSKAVKELNSYVTNLIKTRRDEFVKGNRKTDVLDKILENVQNEDWNDKLVIQLRDEIKTFLFAGHETSSSMLTWAMYELNQNSEYLQRVIDETTEIFGDCTNDKNDDIPFDKIRDGMEFTQACLKESLRKYSIVPVVTRELVEDDNLCGYDIPAGTIVVIPIQAVHNDPTIWKNPQEWNPQRFLEPIDAFAFLGFIAGPRTCIGQFFALLETKIVLGMLLKRFTFGIPSNNVGKKHATQIPICPVDNMLLTIENIN